MSDPWTLRPITRWPGPLTKNRRATPFFAGWEATRDLLTKEIEHLQARNLVIQIAVEERDFRRDGELRAGAMLAHPGVILTFESRHGSLRYACDQFSGWYGEGQNAWRENLRAIALSLEALRKVNRYGVSRGGEQYAGWKALPDGVLTREQAEALLRSYGGEAEALRKTHPDHGGSRDEFERVMAARKLIRGAS